jgi:hypothetical protein
MSSKRCAKEPKMRVKNVCHRVVTIVPSRLSQKSVTDPVTDQSQPQSQDPIEGNRKEGNRKEGNRKDSSEGVLGGDAPSASPTPSDSPQKPKRGRKKRPPGPFPEDWQPNDRHREMVRKHGLNAVLPSAVRVRIRSCSNSARPPKMVSIKRPWGVVVSAHASPSERKPAFLSVIAASVFNRSRVERASRSSRVTISTSPASSWSITRRSCARSVLAPLATARNTLTAPGDMSARVMTVLSQFTPNLEIYLLTRAASR